MAEHRARKRFGQNFLHDPLVIERMLAAIAPRPADKLLEIGPGKGALTIPLLERHGELAAIELDRDLGPPLTEQCRMLGKFRLIMDDVLQTDISQFATGPGTLRVIGNLPYNISTPLLFHLANHAGCISDVHVLLQKEVAVRITAQPGNRDYGRLTVMMQYHFTPEILFDVGPGAFKPAPRVTSSFIRLIPRQLTRADAIDADKLSLIVSTAFAQRRKTLRNSLKNLLAIEKIIAAGLDPQCRPETLTLEQFSALADMLESPPPDRQSVPDSEP